MDAHEFFPEVPELVHKPLVKWVWRSIERLLMPRCDALLTVCDSIAEHYRHGLGVSMSVVRNLPEGESLKVKEERSGAKVLLYQGSVNLGRGVDWAIDALEWLPQCRLVVAGDGDLLESMKAYAAAKPWSDRISFTGRLMPDELQALTPQADVGLVMLEDLGLNYRYALPNRIGDFVQAGVPMVVSDLPEMSAVVKRYGVGEIIERLHGADGQANAQALARAVEKVLARQWTDANFAAARRDMDWNKEKETLINIANKLCSTTSY
jgi:glycosyltransferase involved in cell wall biosynthesis